MAVSKVRACCELAVCKTLATTKIDLARNRRTRCQGQPRSNRRSLLIHFHCCLLRLCNLLLLFALQHYCRMGTTSSLPEEVLTTKVAKYSFQIKKELYAVRTTSKIGLALAQRALSNECVRDARCANFPYGEGWTEYVNHGGPPPEMRASARQVEAMGRVWAELDLQQLDDLEAALSTPVDAAARAVRLPNEPDPREAAPHPA